ncbi:MAG: FG-GAP-like repeat-containing protein [Bacteroidales bacterium]|nr:FG-GAP-like repeat-containing protein [Bacteroidales bacterium]
MKRNLILLLILILSISIKAQICFRNQDTLSTMVRAANKVIVADIDGDGILDAIVSSTGSGIDAKRLDWFKNNNDGNKKFAISHRIDEYAYVSVAAGDLDGNGSIDIVSVDKDYLVLDWFANDGAGNFTKTSIHTYTNSANADLDVEIADIDNDGDNDIIINYPSEHILEWYENTAGDGTTWTEKAITTTDINDFSISDIDNDGDLDIVTAQIGDGQGNLVWRVNILKNNGNASSWTEEPFTNINSIPKCIYTADLNNDNLDDIVLGTQQSNSDSARIMEYINSESGFSEPVKIYAISDSPSNFFLDVQTADLDLDGDQDLIFSSNDNYVRLARNDGSGNFSDTSTITSTVDYPISICAADLDSVQDIDLLIASQNDNTVGYYNNYTAIITQDPQDAAPVCKGDTVMFTVKAINTSSYKWTFAGVNYSSEIENDTLFIPARFYTKSDSVSCSIIGFDPASSKDTSNYAKLYVDVFETADAGTDKGLCEASSKQLSGNNPTHYTGTWSSNIATVTFDNNTLYNATAQNFSQDAIMEMYWTIDNGACGISVDTMELANYINFISDAGSSDTICSSQYQLHGNTPPSLSIATWTCTHSEVTFDDVHKPDALASNLPAGSANESPFRWEINNGACGWSYSSISIFRNEQPTADAGVDQDLCNKTTAYLNANQAPIRANGYWTCSNNEVIFQNSSFNSSSISNIPHGTTTFTWTLEIPACPKSSDDLIINSYNNVNIETEPFNLTVTEGEDAQFGIVATGDVTTYEWQKDNNPLNDDARLAGTATDTLSISNTQSSDAGYYKCIVTGVCNTKTSNEVQLTVNTSSTGFENLKQAGLTIYPNPNNGVFNIISDNEPIEIIKIYNLNGDIIYQNYNLNTKSNRIDISSYKKGIYIMEIYKNNKLIKSKVIIQ